MQNRISYEHIQSMVDSLQFKYSVIDGLKTTVCVAIYQNFTIGFGYSACVDPANFDRIQGESIAHQRAKEDATNKLWEFEGWRLKFQNMPF